MIEVRDVTKIYIRNKIKTTALDHLNLTINDGDIFGIIGYSGAGKSTLIRLFNYLEKPTSGNIVINGKDLGDYSSSELRKVRKKIGMIFQHFNLLQSKTVFHNVAIPLILDKTNKKVIKQRVMELLDFVGLSDKADNYPSELSGGQKQRIGIARALATNPSILLCDEATSALDPQTTESILQLLKKANQEYGVTIVIITHEMSVVQKICNQVAVIEAGKIIEKGSVLEVFGKPQQQTTKDFVETVIHNELPESVKSKLNVSDNSKIYRISLGENSSEPVMNNLIKHHDIQVNILFASMNEIQQITVGHMIIQMIGDKEAIAEAEKYLQEKAISAEEVS